MDYILLIVEEMHLVFKFHQMHCAYTGSRLVVNNLFAIALAGNNFNITDAFSAVTVLFTSTDNTTTNTFPILSANSVCLAPMGISQVDHICTLVFSTFCK